jgi:amino acid adenylation domain-containing protein
MHQPQTTRLLQQIAAWAATRPDAAAVVAAEDALTYAELASRAAALGQALRAAGAGPERLVAVSGERGVSALVALVGVMQSGAGFLVLDERLPDARLTAVLEATQPILALANGDLAGRLRAKGVTVRSAHDLAENAPIPSLAPSQGQEDAAYVVMTSGSTGVPKGVIVERRHLDAYLEAVLQRLGVDAPRDFASVSPLWTDLGHTALFGALWSGGTLHLIPEHVATSASALAAAMERRPVDYLKITPSHLEALLEPDWAARALPRRGVILGGERLAWTLVRRLRELAPAIRLFNHYGPAECTVGVAAGEVPAEIIADARTVPIGQPLNGTTLVLLDDELQPARPGAVGEIYVTGPTVARGYLDDEELTMRRFRSLEVGGLTGRFYRTGDLARTLPDGQLEIVGRADRQVKVRGFRLEPGEVEQALLADRRVRQAYAMGYEQYPGSVELAAFVVPAPATELSEAELLSALRERLAAAALPSRLRVIEAMPHTPANKVDEAELASWLRSAPSERPQRATQSSTETVMADLWTSLLGRSVGPDDNVFEHGANSVAAIRFLARVQQALQVEIPLHEVFERPTVAQLAALADGSGDGPSSAQETSQRKTTSPGARLRGRTS